MSHQCLQNECCSSPRVFRATRRLAFLCGLAAILAGCGRAEVEYAEVAGTVHLGNRPVTSGMVEFLPQANRGTTGPKFLGMIQQDGRFQLVGPNAREGAIPGHYIITILPLPELVPGSSAFGPFRNTAQHERRDGPTIPEQFSREQTSTISVEVVAGSNAFDLDLAALDATSPTGHAAR